MTQPGARMLTESHRCILKALQNDPIGAKPASGLKPLDLVEHCRARKAGQLMRDRGPVAVKPQTVRQDMTNLQATIQFFVDLDELPPSAMDVFRKARKLLQKEQLIAKAPARERRPAPEELEALLSYFDAHCELPMRTLVVFGLIVGRRIGEVCRLRWEDLNEQKKTCLVRDLKNPAGKGFHAAFPLIGESWAIVQSQPRVCDYIFSFKGKQIKSTSVSKAYTEGKKFLGIKDLRLHDNRAEAFSRLFEKNWSVPQVQLVSLHKGDAKMLLSVYARLNPESAHELPL
jgi:integrase